MLATSLPTHDFKSTHHEIIRNGSDNHHVYGILSRRLGVFWKLGQSIESRCSWLIWDEWNWWHGERAGPVAGAVMQGPPAV